MAGRGINVNRDDGGTGGGRIGDLPFDAVDPGDGAI
jgi:hypothetical protein